MDYSIETYGLRKVYEGVIAVKGLSVTLLERAATPGGKMRTVRFGVGNLGCSPSCSSIRICNRSAEHVAQRLTVVSSSMIAVP